MTLTYNGAFESKLKELIAEARETRRDWLENGSVAADYSSYCRHVGYLAALKDVVDIFCAEAAASLDQR